MITFTLQIPDEVAASWYRPDAAEKFGWKSDPNADDATNLQSAIAWCFSQITVPYLARFAAETRIARRSATLAQEEQAAMNDAAAAWLAANPAQ